MGWKADPTKPIKLNKAFFTLCTILRFVVASTAEAELGALFLNCKQEMIFRLTLEQMGHPQPPTLVHCDNSTAVGIANNSFKNSALDQWRCNFSGLQMLLRQGSLTANTTQEERILLTTRALVLTIQQSLLGTYTNRTLCMSFPELASLAL
jgi:hypothetical protein